jgi:hypothetical protein
VGTRLLAFFTAALVIAAGLQFIAAGLQFWAMRGQLDEMTFARRSNDRSSTEQLGMMHNQWIEMEAQSKATEGQLRMLEQQIADARQIQRAFITSSNYKIARVPDASLNSCWRFRPVISNAGASPTVDMRYSTEIIVMALPLPGQQGSANGMVFAPTDPNTKFQRFRGWGGALLGPKQDLPDTPALDTVCLTKDDRPSIWAQERVYARGVIHYRDAYPGHAEHVTKYCFWIRAAEAGNGWEPEPSLCSHWNCADEECDRGKEAYEAEVAADFKESGQTREPPFEFTRQ